MIIRQTNYNNMNNFNALMEQQNKLYDIYNKLNSTHKFSNISENPIDATGVINVNTELQKLETYKKNVNNATTQLDYLDDTFSTIIDKMQRINELAVQAANGAGGTATIEACRTEIKELKENIVALANTQYNGVYIFGGANTTTPPYTLEDDGSIVYSGTPSTDPGHARKLEISDGVYVTLNAAGDQVFGNFDNTVDPPTGEGLFKVLGDLEAALNLDPSDTKQISAQLDNIQNSIAHVSEVQSIFGASAAKLEMTQNTLDETKIILQSQRANLQEIDQAEVISEFIKQNYAYQASMQVYTSMQNNSLLNYM